MNDQNQYVVGSSAAYAELHGMTYTGAPGVYPDSCYRNIPARSTSDGFVPGLAIGFVLGLAFCGIIGVIVIHILESNILR